MPPTASLRASSTKQQQSSVVPAVASTATTRVSRVITFTSCSSNVSQEDASGATRMHRTTSLRAALAGLREGHNAPPYGRSVDEPPTRASYAAVMRWNASLSPPRSGWWVRTNLW